MSRRVTRVAWSWYMHLSSKQNLVVFACKLYYMLSFNLQVLKENDNKSNFFASEDILEMQLIHLKQCQYSNLSNDSVDTKEVHFDYSFI